MPNRLKQLPRNVQKRVYEIAGMADTIYSDVNSTEYDQALGAFLFATSEELQEVEPEITEPAEDISTRHISLVSDIPGYPPGGKLTVTMPNGEKIRHRYAPDTFVEVLEKIGLKRIAELDIMCRNAPLVEMFPSPNVRQRRSGIYYITVDTHSRYMTKMLLRIAVTLDIDLVVGHGPPNPYEKYKKYPKRDPLDFFNF